MSYTKGPWEARKGMFDDRLEIHSCANYEPVKMEICTVETGLNQSFDKEQKANANLIAAAPELLEALELFVSNSTIQTNHSFECELAEKAIAKAKGQL